MQQRRHAGDHLIAEERSERENVKRGDEGFVIHGFEQSRFDQLANALVENPAFVRDQAAPRKFELWIKTERALVLVPEMFDEISDVVRVHLACGDRDPTGHIGKTDDFHTIHIDLFIQLRAFDIAAVSTAKMMTTLPGFIC